MRGPSLLLLLAVASACTGEPAPVPPPGDPYERRFASFMECVPEKSHNGPRWYYVELDQSSGKPLRQGSTQVRFAFQWGVEYDVEVQDRYDRDRKEHTPEWSRFLAKKHRPSKEFSLHVGAECVSHLNGRGGTFTDPTRQTFRCANEKVCRALQQLVEGKFETLRIRGKHPDRFGAPQVVTWTSAPTESAEPGSPDAPEASVARAVGAARNVVQDAHRWVAHDGPTEEAARELRSSLDQARDLVQDHAQHTSLLPVGPMTRSTLEDARKRALVGQASALASGGYAYSIHGVELLRATLNASAPCDERPRDEDDESNPRELRTSGWIRFDAPKQSPMMTIDRQTVQLVWFDEQRDCVATQNVTAELFGREPDANWTVASERDARLSDADADASDTKLRWEGTRGEIEDYVWPPVSAHSAELASGHDGAEQLTLGPHRFTLRSADGSLLYKLNAPSLTDELCMRNQVSIAPPSDGTIRVTARIRSDSRCDQDVHGHERSLCEAIDLAADGSTVPNAREQVYFYGSANCGDSANATRTFHRDGRTLIWSTHSADADCWDWEPIPCAGLVEECAQDLCAHLTDSWDKWGSSLALVVDGKRLPLLHTTVQTFTHVDYKCGYGGTE